MSFPWSQESLHVRFLQNVLTEGTVEVSMGLVPLPAGAGGSQQRGPCVLLHQSPGGGAMLVTTC